MKLCNEITLLMIGVLIVMSLNTTPNKTQPQIVIETMFWMILLYYLYQKSVVERFHFEVTPWKKTCLFGNPPDPRCCKSGFHGQPVQFEYISDAQRMNDAQNGCYGEKRDFLPNYVNDYTRMGETYGEGETYTLNDAYKQHTTFPIVESYSAAGGCGC